MFLLFFLALCYSCTTFFLIRHIYKIHAETKRLLSCDRKLFLLYVVNSRLKKFFCCLLQGIILSSQITIYTSHCTFLLLQYVNDLCRRSEYLRIRLLCIPTKAPSRKNHIPNLSRIKRLRSGSLEIGLQK